MTAAVGRFTALPARARHAWLDRPPGRAAGRSHHPGPAAVTTAGLAKPEPRAEAPRPWSGPFEAGLRLVRLHLASRRVPGALAALALCGLVLRAALYWHWSLGSGPGAQELAVVLEAGAASVIAVTAQSPFGDPERATGRWLPYLRLGTAVGSPRRQSVRCAPVPQRSSCPAAPWTSCATRRD